MHRERLTVFAVLLAMLYHAAISAANPPLIDFGNEDIESIDIDFEFPNGSIFLLYKLKNQERRKIVVTGPSRPGTQTTHQIEFEATRANDKVRINVDSEFIHKLMAMRLDSDTFDLKLEGGFFSVLLLHRSSVMSIQRWGPSGVLSIANGRWNEVFRAKPVQLGEAQSLDNKEVRDSKPAPP